MTCTGAELMLRIDRDDRDLRLLRLALSRVWPAMSGLTLTTVFVDGAPGLAHGATSCLRNDLEASGRLAGEAEITWHGPGTEEAVRGLRVSRRSLSQLPKTPARHDCPLALDVAGPDLVADDLPARIEHWLHRGVVHLGLQGGTEFVRDDVRRFDAAVREYGFQRYEAANWALPGHEARWLTDARHGKPIIGIGPGNYGRCWDGAGWSWLRSWRGSRWRADIELGGDGRGVFHRLSGRDRATERLIEGLRLPGGIDLHKVEIEAGLPSHAWLDEEGLHAALADGRLLQNGSCVAVADLDEADELAAMLLPARDVPSGRA